MQNFLMDFIALVAVNLFLHRHRKCRYLIAGAALSSVVGLLLLLMIRNYVVYCVAGHLILNICMVAIAFGRCEKRTFVENWMISYFVVILLGGLMEWLNRSSFLSHNFVLLLIAAVTGVYTFLCYLMQRRDLSNHILQTVIYKEERCMEIRAYWDSGNQLRDPYTGQGICILSHSKAHHFFTEQRDRFRLVPFQSMGEKDGLLWVTDVDKLQIMDGKQMKSIPHVAIGIASEGLLEDKEYDLILHASIL